MKIVREKASQRRHHRLTAPLSVFYHDKKYRTRDWSIGGIGLYINNAKQPKIGREFTLKISLPFQGYDIQFSADTRVVRFDEKARLVGLEFIDLPQRSRDLLAYFSEDLIRGHMGTFEDSICRIDIPVTPISTQPTTGHISDTPVRRLPFKTVFMTLAYVIFGMAIFGYLGLLLYSNFFRLEVKSSVISTEMRIIKMPVDGFINAEDLEVGAQIKVGQKLLGYEDTSLEKQIIAANLTVDQAKKELWRAKKMYQIENEHKDGARSASGTDKKLNEAKLFALRAALAAADANLSLIREQGLNNIPSFSRYEVALTERAKAASLVKQTELIISKNAALAAASRQSNSNRLEFAPNLNLSSVDLEMAHSQLKAKNDELDILLNYKSKTTITAPFPGRVTKIYQNSPGYAAKGEQIMLFERSDQLFVTAFLNQQEIMHIGLNDNAKIYIPSLGKSLTAIVSSIDRHSLLLNKSSTHYVWREDKVRSAVVHLWIDMDSPNVTGIRTGMPVVTIFNRKTSSELWSAFLQIFTSNSSYINVRENEKN